MNKIQFYCLEEQTTHSDIYLIGYNKHNVPAFIFPKLLSQRKEDLAMTANLI
jgi:hypothetical protein